VGDRDVQAVLADLNSPPWDYKDGSKYTDYEAIKNYAGGMDLGAITKASGALTTVGKLYDGSLQNLQSAAQMLGEAWQGGGADDALTNLKQLYVAVGTMKNTHANLGTLLSQHVEMMQPFQDFFTKNLEDATIPPDDPNPPAVFANMKNDFSKQGRTNVKVPQGTIANADTIMQQLRQQYYKANPQVRTFPLDQPIPDVVSPSADWTVQSLALSQARLQNSQNAIGVASQSVVDSFVAFPEKVSVTLPAPNVPAPPNPVVGPGNQKVPGPGSSKYPGLPSTGPGTTLPQNGATTPPGVNVPGANVPGANLPPGTTPPGTNPSQLPPGVTNPTDPSHLSSNPPGTTPPGTTPPGTTPPGTTPPGLTPPGTTPPGTTPPGTTPPVLTPPGTIPPPSSTTPPNEKIPKLPSEKIPKLPNEKFPEVKPGGIGDTNLPSGSNPNLGTNGIGTTGAQDTGGNPSAAQEGTFAEEAAMGRTAAMSAAGMGSGMMPMAPMMGGPGGAGGQEHDRMAWMAEDEDIWEAGHDAVPPVIG
jgi:hypothetical protein